MRRIRLSYGSAVELGLTKGNLEARPTTAYLFLKDRGCRGNCGFCPQSLGRVEERISRVSWPEFLVSKVKKGIAKNKALQRICIQCTNEPYIKNIAPKLVRDLRKRNGLPISVSTSPITLEQAEELKEAGADILTIPLDCAEKRLFPLIKGRSWSEYWRALMNALKIFGSGKVGTHLIVGLGETERSVITLTDKLWRMGVVPSLFAFTPIRGTRFEFWCVPPLSSYRRIQLARKLIIESKVTVKDIKFSEDGRIREFCLPMSRLEEALEDGNTFMTQGCPGCNRPYFNERVSGPIFNYAYEPRPEDLVGIRGEIFGTAKSH